MADYERQLKNGLWLAKRGYVYYLYNTVDDLKGDDYEVSLNVERFNNGTEVFNRAYSGSWLFRTRKMSEIKDFAREMETYYNRHNPALI